MDSQLQKLFTRVSDLILGDKETAPDKDCLISTSIVKCLSSFNKINEVVLRYRFKKLSASKVESVGVEVSKSLFYAATLAFVLDQDNVLFDEDSINSAIETLPTNTTQDVILSSLYGICNLCDIADLIYVESDLETVLSGKEGIRIKEEDLPIPGEESLPIEMDELSYMAVAIFAACKMICDRLELSFENLVYNAALYEAI